jgi:malonate transporter MadL subunit
VGIAMMLLIAARIWLNKRGLWTAGVNQGVMLWASLYIPIVVAMAAQQDVAAAVTGGPMVLIGGIGVVCLCFAMVALIGRVAGRGETMDEIEARDAAGTADNPGAAA